jgi:alpha-1,6-mannosyltransferase
VRVVDVTSFFADACGGIRTYYEEKARHLPRLGVECHFVVPGESETAERLGAATLHRLPGTPMLGSRFYRRFRGVAPLRGLLAHLRPDVIEIGSHYLLPDLVRAALWGLDLRPAIVGFYHADFPRTYVAPTVGRIPGLGAAAVRAAWSLVTRQHRRYRATLAASRHVAIALAEHGVPDVRWVGLGVDTLTFRPRARRPEPRTSLRVGYAGRLATEKDVELVLDAAPEIHAATGAEVVVAGDGPLAPRVQTMARARAGVRYVGLIREREAMAEFLADCDVVLAPGRHETFSLAAAEAMACGTPVIGARRGGNGELVSGAGTDLGFRAGSARDLARVTIELLRATSERRAELGAQGRRHVETLFAWDRVVARIAGVYDEVAA